MNKLLLIILLCCTISSGYAQVSSPAQRAQIEALLADRDIDEAELRQRLEAKGIRIDNLTPQQALQIRPQIEAVIAELEAEKAKAEQPESATPPPAEDVEDQGEEPDVATTEMEDEPEEEALPPSSIYGHQIFRNKSLKVYQKAEGSSLPENYPLKPGDEVAVAIFGASQTDFILRLDDQGFVKLSNGYRMPLSGVPLAEARMLLANRLRQFYTFRDGQLSIRIQAVSTISVNIFGEVENNGSFTMPSSNSGFNALVAAGGPTEAGSVRNIQLIQGDKTVLLDVYEYLENPTQSTSLFLSDNATIFVPLAKTVVSLEGGVQRPLRYELKEGENLTDLLNFAGGLKPRAETGNIRVTRYVNGRLELFNVDLGKEPSFALRNEDVVTVPIIENPIENFVTIEGAVLLPGRYAFGEGVSLGELLDLGRLRPEARTDVAFLFRSNDNGTTRSIRLDLGADAGARDIELQRGDRLQILSSSAFNDSFTFTVSGAVRDSSVTLPFPQDGGLTLEEAVLLAGGLEPNAAPEVVLMRTPINNREEKNYERLDLRQDANFALQPLDQVVVYRQERFSDKPTVSISGAVRAPGVYTYDPSLNIRDLLYLAGELRMDAARDRVEVFRLQFTEGSESKTLLETINLDDGEPFKLQAFDEVIVRSAAEFETIKSVVIQGEVRYPGRYALLEDNEKLSDLIRRSGGLTQEAFPAGATLYRPETDIGYVVLDLDRIVKDASDPANMVVRAGDTLYVPKKNELVTIYTAGTLADRYGRDSTTIDGSIQVAFQGDRPADWYIDNYAGGFANNARPRWTTVEYANGQIKETRHFLLTEKFPRLAPGARIRVGLKPPKVVKQRREERFDWIGLTQVVLGAVGTIATLWIVSNRQ